MTRFSPALLLLILGSLSSLAVTAAGPFSKSQAVNFYREVVPRDISGLALRSDGRLIAGPALSALAGTPAADLWWDLERLDNKTWLVASGPDGYVQQLSVDLQNNTFESTAWAESGANHVFVIKNLGDGMIAGGTNPEAAVIMWNQFGEERTRVNLPGDSVLDLLWDESTGILWVATGNPGALYQIDLDQLLNSELADAPADRGVTLRATIRDRNLRRLARTPEGDILGGSTPGGNLYRFDRAGSPPLILMDHESGEVTDIQVSTEGDIYATLVVASGNSTRRLIQSANVQSAEEPEATEKPEAPQPTLSIMEAPPIDAFTGRSELILIPRGVGIPETLSARNKMAMYRFARYQNFFVIGGGDDGELLGYIPDERRALSFSGSDSAQINDIEPTSHEGQFLLLTNNPTGLSLLDFNARAPRVVRTTSLNLQTPSYLGALRFNRIRDVDPTDIVVRMRANRGRDPVEGWTPWITAVHELDGWRAPGLVGTQAQIEIALPSDLSDEAQLDQAELHYLPQNRRPVLRSFRIISPNFALAPRAPTVGGPVNMTLGQLTGSAPNPASDSDNQARQALLSSSLVPQLGAQIVTWTASDADGDELSATFSIRREDEENWVDLGVDLTQGWFQFDRRGLAEGTYFTRLLVQENAPRPVAERQEIDFATDDLVIDLTPPEITDVSIQDDRLAIEIDIVVSDARSLISGLTLKFNNGHELTLEQPADGILDGRAERFRHSVSQKLVAGATTVEVYVEDAAGNLAIKRVELR